MFGISPLGWLHTLGSLPAIPVAFYMFARAGRIDPRSRAGALYFIFMLIGIATVFPVSHSPVGNVFAIITLVLLLTGYGISRIPHRSRAAVHVETISLTLTAFLLMLPTVTEILRRVPDGHPFVSDLNSPLLKGVHGILLLGLIIGLTLQIRSLRKQSRAEAIQPIAK
ncbi:hypothetical protein JIN84_19440 [Luteolibacter yonseiensis]|uniref:DUF2306 domain-containing protein n=1 Tax=Luteolibacter yonseiensis TaxID=1144680 RepID=A0A934R3P2_9BACT|nr:hypothetical protein [Luteolibacter yonseiensis]MBK1817803.1 hypothetical protein [Luteolibacter yonseiensis]